MGISTYANGLTPYPGAVSDVAMNCAVPDAQQELTLVCDKAPAVQYFAADIYTNALPDETVMVNLTIFK